ncbi:hypothetical protein [Streptomyces sp. NBC_00557]|uniref:hypothetical protein n=1 Tax=Streptomyces sp. NBC_00557 TaxID=2975776 RepID=UPI002E82039C|nr:hypothetical protein [Streptomyces sp. NBC_00557]WUC40265.1 hypothetical protein OG956_39590 [Streptomyces sp. NBC_00557]
MQHRKPHTSKAAKTAVRLGAALTAGLAMTAVTTAARATPGRAGVFHDVATAVDAALSHADRTHVNQFDQSFAIHEYGPSVAVTANNRATAVSAGCSPADPCRSVALSYQILTTAGRSARLINATNLSRSVNEHCPACQTLAAAYQFVVATPRQFSLSRQAREQLNGISRQVAALKTSRLPIEQITQRADELARQVKAVLDREAARAPRTSGGSDPLADFTPTVTMHRHVR